MRRSIPALIVVALAALAVAFAQGGSYLANVATSAGLPEGEPARYFHWTTAGFPVRVHIPAAPEGAPADAAVTARAGFEAWAQAAPDLVSFEFVTDPADAQVLVEWSQTIGAIGSWRYTWARDETGWRLAGVTAILPVNVGGPQLRVAAVLQAGRGLGLLGRSPFQGDALGPAPSGSVTGNDVATLRELYQIPVGQAR